MHTLLRLYVVPEEPLCPLAVDLWIFYFNMGRMPTTAGMTLVHRNSMDTSLLVTVIPAFFICPNALKGFEDISNMKGRSNNESNRQAQKECGNSEAAALQYCRGKETGRLYR